MATAPPYKYRSYGVGLVNRAAWRDAFVTDMKEWICVGANGESYLPAVLLPLIVAYCGGPAFGDVMRHRNLMAAFDTIPKEARGSDGRSQLEFVWTRERPNKQTSRLIRYATDFVADMKVQIRNRFAYGVSGERDAKPAIEAITELVETAQRCGGEPDDTQFRRFADAQTGLRTETNYYLLPPAPELPICFKFTVTFEPSEPAWY